MELLQLQLAYTKRERDEAQRRERDQGQQFREERDRLLGIIETQTKQTAAIGPLSEINQPLPPEKRGFWRKIFS